MKTGMIFYVTGNKDSKEKLDSKEFKGQLPSADLHRFAVTEQDVVNYWWELTARGMQRILCRIIRVDESNKLQVSERTLRLYG